MNKQAQQHVEDLFKARREVLKKFKRDFPGYAAHAKLWKELIQEEADYLKSIAQEDVT